MTKFKTIALKTNLKTSWMFAMACLLCLLAVYIIQVGSLARDKYTLKNYERELSSLSKNNKFLDIDFSKMDSLSRVEQVLAQNSGFVKTNNVKYIKIADGSIASIR